MTALTHLAILYAVAGIIVGFMVSSAETVNFNWPSGPSKYPRFWAGLISAVIWPVIAFKIVTGW